MDATGFSVKQYAVRWHSTAYSSRRKEFLKVHGLIERESQAFLSWEFTDASVHDTLVMPTLLDRARCAMESVHADAGYLSSMNVHAIVSHGAKPYVRPRINTKGRPPHGAKDQPSKRTGEDFRTMIDAYHQNERLWLQNYSQRNSVVSAWSGLKRRFAGAVSAVSLRMRRCEAALKLVVWNITRVVRLT